MLSRTDSWNEWGAWDEYDDEDDDSYVPLSHGDRGENETSSMEKPNDHGNDMELANTNIAFGAYDDDDDNNQANPDEVQLEERNGEAGKKEERDGSEVKGKEERGKKSERKKKPSEEMASNHPLNVMVGYT